MVAPEYSEKLLIVCAVCNRFRDDEGQWTTPDKLVLRPDQKVSHAICRQCGLIRYPRYSERRKYPRQLLHILVKVRTRLSDDDVVAVNGVTVNLSSGGMLALLQDRVPFGADGTCAVQFKESDGVVEPEFTSGVLVRSEPRGPDYDVAIDFRARRHIPRSLQDHRAARRWWDG